MYALVKDNGKVYDNQLFADIMAIGRQYAFDSNRRKHAGEGEVRLTPKRVEGEEYFELTDEERADYSIGLHQIENYTAYGVGFEDGQQEDLNGATEPEALRWDESAIHALGISAFGAHVGLTDEEVAEAENRGDAWLTACGDYNLGVIDGILSRR